MSPVGLRGGRASGPGDRAPWASPRRGLPGIAVAGLTAGTSGVSVFVNGYGVHAIRSAAVYTTAKNLVATLVLVLLALGARSWARRRPSPTGAPVGRAESSSPQASAGGGMRPHRLLRWMGLAYVGIVGGGVAFVLFFDGLADSSATPAAFWHDTLVVWVAVLAVPVLGERPRWWNGAAIVVLVAGQAAMAGGVGQLRADRGELLVLSATVLWALEVVVAKVLLRDIAPAVLAVVRMGVGAVTLLVYLGGAGLMGELVSLDLRQAGWALLTGLLLAVYVGTWMTALSRARAVDVSSVLVGGALVTALLQAMAGSAPLASGVVGLVLIALGTSTVVAACWRNETVRDTGGLTP